MPRIRTYSAEAPTPHPTGVASETAAAKGRARAAGIEGFATPILGAIKEGTAFIQNIEEENESAKLAADLATTQANLTKQWLDTARTADPNQIDQVRESFLQDTVAPALDEVGGKLNTRAGRLMFEKARAGIGAHFTTTTAADGAQIAGQAAVQNWVTMENQLTSATRTDPSSFEHNMALGQLALDGMTEIPAVEKMKLQNALGKAGASAKIVGLAQAGAFDQARKELGSGRLDKFLDAGDKETLQSHIETEERTVEAAKRAADLEQRRAVREQSDQVAQQIVSNVPMDQNNYLIPSSQDFETARKIADPEIQRTTFNFLRGAQDRYAAHQRVSSDPATISDFHQRLWLPDDNPQKLTMSELQQAHTDEKVSGRDFDLFRKWMDKRSDPQYRQQAGDFQRQLSTLRSNITKSNPLSGQGDQAGDQKWGEFQAAMTQYWQQSQGTKSRDQIWQDVVNFVPAYQPYRSVNEALQAIIDNATRIQRPLAPGQHIPYAAPGQKAPTTPPAPVPTIQPWKPGESAEQFLKRNGF